MSIEKDQLRKILEGAILASGQPMSVANLLALFEADEEEGPSKEDVQAALEDIQADCCDRGFELKEVATGWRFQVREESARWVNRLWDEKPQKYSRALLETVALIAYRQPITRGDIEEIRGVAVSSHIIKTLSERDWIKAVGHRDVPGRPSLFATTRQFLDYFNLKSLEDLPSLGEIRDLDALNKELDLGEEERAAVKQALVEEALAAEAEKAVNAMEEDDSGNVESGEISEEAAIAAVEGFASEEGSVDNAVVAAAEEHTERGDLDPDFNDSYEAVGSESFISEEVEVKVDPDELDEDASLSNGLEESHDA